MYRHFTGRFYQSIDILLVNFTASFALCINFDLVGFTTNVHYV